MKTSLPITGPFAALIVAQTAHSVEEYVGRLWETFPPAMLLTALVATDREIGFLVINIALVAFGYWCLFWPVRRRWPSAQAFVWFWIIIQLINGVGHPYWAARIGGYTPGVATAPVLLVIAVYLATLLIRNTSSSATASTSVSHGG